MFKTTFMTDNCTNVRQTENLITSVQNVSLQRNKLKYKQNASIIFLNHRTIIFKRRDRIMCTTVLNMSA